MTNKLVDYRELSLKEIQEYELEMMKAVHLFLVEHNIPYYMLGGSILGAVRHKGFIPWDDDIDIGIKREHYDKLILLFDDFNKQYKGLYEIKNFMVDNVCNYILIRVFRCNTYRIDTEQSKKMDHRMFLDIFPLDNLPNDELEFESFSKKLTKEKNIRYFIFPHKTSGGFLKMFLKRIYSLPYYVFRKHILSRGDALIKKYASAQSNYLCSCASQYSPLKQKMNKSIYGDPILYFFEGENFYGPADAHNYLKQLFGDDYMLIPPVNKRRDYTRTFIYESKK